MRERREEFDKKLNKYVKRMMAKTGMFRRKALREMYSNPEDAARELRCSTMAVYRWAEEELSD